MFQSKPDPNHVSPNVTIDNVTLNVVDTFTCLGSTLSENAMIDHDISARLGKASASLGRLTKRLWQERGDVLTTLLYGCEAWTWRRTYNPALRVWGMNVATYLQPCSTGVRHERGDVLTTLLHGCEA